MSSNGVWQNVAKPFANKEEFKTFKDFFFWGCFEHSSYFL
jgi:hypothetical protein